MTNALAACALRTLLRDRTCRKLGGRCDCMLLCHIEADEIVTETAESFRRECAAIMQGPKHTHDGED